MLHRPDRSRRATRARYASFFDQLEDRTLMSVANPLPTGGIATISNTQIVGFASDKSDSTATLTITIKVDGVVNTTLTADQTKPAGAKGNGPTGHWFTANLSGVDTGAHFIQIYANDVSTGDQVLIASKSLNNQAPKGTVDVVNTTTISGSAFDPDNPNAAINIVVQVDKTTYSPVSAASPSGDAGLPDPNHGFSMNMPTVLFGKHTVKVFAVDPLDGSQTLIGTKTFVNAAPVGKFESATGGALKGYVYDPDHKSTSIEYLVLIDGNVAARLTANGDRPDLVKKVGSANHGISITLNGLPSGKHKIQLFGVDPDSGVTRLIGTKTVTV